jgi:HD-GYP domain-containing protein (c-di-GMP phosphodiesterase class II)
LTKALHPFVYGKKEFVLHIVAGQLFLSDVALSRETLEFQQLVEDLQSRHIHTLVFRRGLVEDELYQLVLVLNESEEFWRSHAGNAGAELLRRGITHAQISAGTVLGGARGHVGDVYRHTERQDTVVLNYRRAIDVLWTMGRDIITKRSFNVKTVRASVNTMLRDLVEEKDLCARLTTIKSFDDYTFNHSVNVALVSMLIGDRLRLSADDIETLGTAAMMHDIGKLAVAPEVLNKRDALTEKEWVEIRAHPARGAQLILDQGEPEDIAVTVAFEHHAGFSGQGYPSLMPGKQQHLFSRIVAIADVFDALSSPRTYRTQLSSHGAIKHVLRDAGNILDPLLVKVFFSLTGLYPMGTVVQLNTGETGVVHSNNESSPKRPVVRLMRDAAGAQTPPQLVNLQEVPEEQVWVTQTVSSEQMEDGAVPSLV